MLHALNALLAPAMMERATLWANHLLAAEPVAAARLAAHAGRVVRLEPADWPSLLPAPPVLAFLVTPAGLLEWVSDPAQAAAADLQIRIDASNPALIGARLLTGERPAVQVQGDAALAADVNWLLENLRWDVEADLARVVDPRVAHELARAGAALLAGVRRALGALAGVAARMGA